jgi:hypothetical protein
MVCLAWMGHRRLAFTQWKQLLLVADSVGVCSEEYDTEGLFRHWSLRQAPAHVDMVRTAVAMGVTEVPTILERATLR